MKNNLVSFILLLLFCFCVEGKYPLDSAHVVLSFPHSGNHAFRFMVEYLSEMPTRGCFSIKSDSYICKKPFKEKTLLSHVDAGLDPFVYKEHWIKRIKNICSEPETLVVIVRDFKEALPSWGRTKNRNMLSEKNLKWYMDIIDYYDVYSGKKMMLYYEDLISCPSLWVESIYDFYQIKNEQRFEYFINNIESIMKTSREMDYKKNVKNLYLGCYKGRSKNKIDFYQERICQKSIKISHDMIMKDYKNCLKYINCYL